MCESERSGTPFPTDRRGLSAPVGSTTTEPMTTISCALLWVLTPLLIVLVAIAWALETKRDRARRWRRSGVSQREIADRLGCTRWRVRQLLA
jgi:hypothetical protein